MLGVGIGEAKQTSCGNDQPLAPTERIEGDQDPIADLEMLDAGQAEGRPEDPGAKASAEIAHVDPFGSATTRVRLKAELIRRALRRPETSQTPRYGGRGGIHGGS